VKLLVVLLPLTSGASAEPVPRQPQTVVFDLFPEKCNDFWWADKLWVKITGNVLNRRKKSQITLYLPVMRMDIRCVGMTSQVHHLYHPE